MRVLHIVNLEGRGGMEHLFLGYLGATPKADAGRACVATKDDVNEAHRTALAACRAPVYNLKRRGRLRLPPFPGLRRWNLARILAAAQPDRAVLWSTLPTPAWKEVCRRRGVEMIYYDHGKAWQVEREAGRRGLAGVQRALTVSHAGRRILQERLDFQGDVTVVPNGLRFAVEAGCPRDIAGQPLQIGFAGRLVDHKGVPVLLAAARRLRQRGVEFHLRIAGSGPEEAALRELCARSGLERHVTFPGVVADMPGFYRTVDVVVVPSLREPFGLTSIEAAAFGAVPIVARIDGLAETVHHGKTGLALPAAGSLEAYRALGGHGRDLPEAVYDPDADALRPPGIIEPETLADALAKLADEPAELARMSAAAMDFARERFRHQHFVERLDREFYRT